VRRLSLSTLSFGANGSRCKLHGTWVIQGTACKLASQNQKLLPTRSVRHHKILSSTKNLQGQIWRSSHAIKGHGFWSTTRQLCCIPQIFQLPWITATCNDIAGGSQRSYKSIPAFARKPFLHPDTAKKMENQSQWGKICTGDFHHPQKDVPTSDLGQPEDARYLGLHLDRRLNWRKHIFTKQLGIQPSKMYWLLGSKSQLSIESKLLLYKAILKPIWTCGVLGAQPQFKHGNNSKISK